MRPLEKYATKCHLIEKLALLDVVLAGGLGAMKGEKSRRSAEGALRGAAGYAVGAGAGALGGVALGGRFPAKRMRQLQLMAILGGLGGLGGGIGGYKYLTAPLNKKRKKRRR
jgi:hypothetical protein